MTTATALDWFRNLLWTAVLASGRKGVEVRALPPAHSPLGSTMQLYVELRWAPRDPKR